MIAFDIDHAQPVLAKLRQNPPLIHCLTNNVSKPLVANALLAVGAIPAMVEGAREVPMFTRQADNLLVNLGSLNDARISAISEASTMAHWQKKPWVLDPVGVGSVLTYRSSMARELLAHRPAALRANAAEVLFLAGKTAYSRGADSLNDSTQALNAASRLALQWGMIVVVTGQVDYITDGHEFYSVSGGDSFMPRISGTGCALSALVAAMLSMEHSLVAAATACYLMKRAGAYAGQHANGLGSFAMALLDGLTQPRSQPTLYKNTSWSLDKALG